MGTDASVLEDALPEEVVGHARPELREHAARGVIPQPPRVDALELRLHRLDDCHVRVVVLQSQQPLSFDRQPLSLGVGLTGKSMQKADCRESAASSSFQFHSSKPSSVAAAISVGVRSSQLLSQMTATPPSHASALPQPSRIAVSTCALSSSLHDSCFAGTSSSAPSGAAAGRWRVSTMTTPSASWSMCWCMRRGRAGSLGPRRWVEYLSTQPAWLSHARKRCAHHPHARSGSSWAAAGFRKRQRQDTNSPLTTISLGGKWLEWSHLERGERLWPDVHGERLGDVERDLLDQAGGRHRHRHPDTHTHPEEQRPFHSDVELQRELMHRGQHAALRLLRRWGRGGAGPTEGLQVQPELPVSNDIAATLRRMQPRCQRYRGSLRVRV